MIWSKKSKPWVRFYSIEDGVEVLHPVFPATKLKRPWMSKPISKREENIGHTSLCPGIRLLVGTGWILPAPADFKIKTNGDGENFQWQSSTRFGGSPTDEPTYITSHPPPQTTPILDNPNTQLNTVIKVDTPWRIQCSEDVMLLQLPVPYNNEPRFSVQPGLIDPQYTHNLNIQLVWNVINGEEWVTAGTPLAHYIPIPRSYMSQGAFDVQVDGPTELDVKRENAFRYANKSTQSGAEHDTLKFRLSKIKKILQSYRKK